MNKLGRRYREEEKGQMERKRTTVLHPNIKLGCLQVLLPSVLSGFLRNGSNGSIESYLVCSVRFYVKRAAIRPSQDRE